MQFSVIIFSSYQDVFITAIKYIEIIIIDILMRLPHLPTYICDLYDQESFLVLMDVLQLKPHNCFYN